MIPYGRPDIRDEDIAAVEQALKDRMLTTGPAVARFERRVADLAGGRHGIAVSNGTAALHTMYAAAGLGPGDEVIVPAITFAATANAALYTGAEPVFADVDPDTLLVDPSSIGRAITDRTRAIVAVDFAGQPADHQTIASLCKRHDLIHLSDAAHALGAEIEGRTLASYANAVSYSFHPVKQITTCEGGMVVTNDDALASRARRFRNHGIDLDHQQRADVGTWRYDITELGYNYRLSDVQCELGSSQLRRLDDAQRRRHALARRYDQLLEAIDGVGPLVVRSGIKHAHHLYVVRIDVESFGMDRNRLFESLRAAGIGVAVHYPAVHLFTMYHQRRGTDTRPCPNAEAAADSILTLPLYPGLSNEAQDQIVDAIRQAPRAVTATSPQGP